MLPNFWRMIWRNSGKTVSKRASSALCLRYRNHFSPELEISKHENWMLNIYCCQSFEEWLMKCWQNRLKVCFECSVPSVQKPLLAENGSSEERKWNGEPLFLPNFWIMIWRNADKTVTKRASSALCFRYRNHFSLELEVSKHANRLVNIHCCQNL